MGFQKRKRAASSTANPFGRKLSPEDASARDAPRAVQQSLFSAIRTAGYEGSAASSIAWRLIKAVRPSMSQSDLSRAQLGGVPREELEELRACVEASGGKESIVRDPNRAGLVSDILAMLDGYLSRTSQASPAPAGGAGAARGGGAPADDHDSCGLCGSTEEHGAHTEISAEEKRPILARIAALRASGASAGAAARQAWSERFPASELASGVRGVRIRCVKGAGMGEVRELDGPALEKHLESGMWQPVTGGGE